MKNFVKILPLFQWQISNYIANLNINLNGCLIINYIEYLQDQILLYFRYIV